LDPRIGSLEMTKTQSPETAGATYSELVVEQLAEERARKASLEGRGLSVITTSGILVTLILGLSAVVNNTDGFELPDKAKLLIVAAGGLFVLAAIGGITANFPSPYREIRVSALRRLTEERWWLNQVSPAQRRAAQARIDILDAARVVNAWKVRFLVAALIFEVLAVLALAAAAGIVLVQ
jgi:hypothetical protein